MRSSTQPINDHADLQGKPSSLHMPRGWPQSLPICRRKKARASHRTANEEWQRRRKTSEGRGVLRRAFWSRCAFPVGSSNGWTRCRLLHHSVPLRTLPWYLPYTRRIEGKAHMRFISPVALIALRFILNKVVLTSSFLLGKIVCNEGYRDRKACTKDVSMKCLFCSDTQWNASRFCRKPLDNIVIDAVSLSTWAFFKLT